MANTTENTDVIQDIDDPCDEEYVENFAPKAQEEILSELQDNNQIDEGEDISCQPDENATNEEITSTNNESNDVLNEEEIHETSDLLIKQVITDAESNLNTDEEFHVTEDYKSDINIDNSQDSETNIETGDSDEKNVDVEMEEPSFEVEINIQKNEENQEETVNIEANEEPDLPEMKADIQEQSEHKSEETQEEIHVEAESEHAVEVDNEQSEEVDKVDVEKTESAVSPTKGKDVKSLSSTYGHEENITNGDCCICNKIVYPMEKLSTNDRLYHKICFRCTKCKNALSTGNFTFNQGKPYCTPHYVELFKKRGRYDEIDNNVEGEHSIVADNETLVDELPAPHTTKNIVAKFTDMGSNAGGNTNSAAVADSSDELPPPNTTKKLREKFTTLGQEKPESKCKPKIDIPRHANGHANGSSENEPVVLSKDVVRSNEPGQDDKPEQGITKNLVDRFTKMEGSSTN